MERNRNVVVDLMVVGKQKKCVVVVVVKGIQKNILAMVVSVEGK